MINLVQSYTRLVPNRYPSKTPVLLQLSEAYRSYRQFRSLPAERLADMGLTKQDQAEATLGQFIERASNLNVR